MAIVIAANTLYAILTRLQSFKIYILNLQHVVKLNILDVALCILSDLWRLWPLIIIFIIMLFVLKTISKNFFRYAIILSVLCTPLGINTVIAILIYLITLPIPTSSIKYIESRNEMRTRRYSSVLFLEVLAISASTCYLYTLYVLGMGSLWSLVATAIYAICVAGLCVRYDALEIMPIAMLPPLGVTIIAYTNELHKHISGKHDVS